MKYKLLLSILFSVTSVLFPQETNCKYYSIQWFPSHLNIQPFTANVLEARSGFVFFTNKSNLQLNAGSSQDIFNYRNKNDEFSLGADIFTFTRLRSTKEFKFPVETIDYLFGINLGYKTTHNNLEKGIRFRLSHISTHQVDGDYDSSLAVNWRNNRVPIVYSREFIEIIPYVKYEDLRLYAGFTYLFHVLPSNINKYIYQTGFDYYYVNCKLPFSPFAAYDLKIEKREVKYTGNNNISTGIKFGSPSGKGFSIYYSYVSGYSVHGQLYNEKEKYSAIGINLDL